MQAVNIQIGKPKFVCRINHLNSYFILIFLNKFYTLIIRIFYFMYLWLLCIRSIGGWKFITHTDIYSTIVNVVIDILIIYVHL